ncbi:MULTISPECIES: helix-turn-helix domain-containing protein [unclassified Enterococcus]|uniref:helix-turn-helix domain-containing protein n=1 Tax=unclassified Enterococcus TaxID=2608891 RepID=UPI001554E15C|nr:MULTISPECIES: helix-turn-helix domain-containing protein [unclassified Enterococcus]MBS7577313.1 helix-turn-helix domain-containing protein [Enterococcus sp. MMGLQ5-2]MBS7584594.1 helix-turn-helix domain-containing protein [Enterococcus sp. MMGLQ5-1]NPD12449.1 hypothetical protein [Enterococcus sp. MMGLQ5-1]NPD37147.1 hypothetical protein [Enterococcus sp. MMGLQ5-2]
MKIEQFLTIFPTARAGATGPEYFSVELEQQIFGIKADELTIREKDILSVFLPVGDAQLPTNLWLKKLNDQHFNNQSKFRLIQFVINQATNQSDFIASIKLLVPNVDSVFFIDEYQGLIVETFQANHLTLEELEDIFQAMGIDFALEIRAYAGIFIDQHQYQPMFYQVEAEYFSDLRSQRKKRSVVTFADYFLSHLQLFDFTSPIAAYLAGKLIADEDLSALIIALWESENSLSLTSQNLFIHRNTLQYKLKKFQEEFGFSLKSLRELAMTYLLIINQ